MKQKSPVNPNEKQNLHPRNLHRFPYDFKILTKGTKALGPFVFTNQYNVQTIDFANPEAVKTLNKAILNHFYNIPHWDIPPGYLCPPIPGRADYIHYLADLLAGDGAIPKGAHINGLDIGTGANCVYPIVGHQSYQWRFTATDIDPVAIASAESIVRRNPDLTAAISCMLQTNSANIFTNVVQQDDKFDFTMCNPPFHASLSEANNATQRKWQNLGKREAQQKGALNFGGQHGELWCPGGEPAFLSRMIEQSLPIRQQCLWFTSLVSKKTTLPRLYQSLKQAGVADVKTIGMSQGQKVSRILAWTFLDQGEQKEWKVQRWSE